MCLKTQEISLEEGDEAEVAPRSHLMIYLHLRQSKFLENHLHLQILVETVFAPLFFCCQQELCVQLLVKLNVFLQ